MPHPDHHDGKADALEAALASAQATLDAYRAESGDHGPTTSLGWADGVAEARRRYGSGHATGDASDAARDDQAAEDVPASGAAAGREEARRRAAARQP